MAFLSPFGIRTAQEHTQRENERKARERKERNDREAEQFKQRAQTRVETLNTRVNGIEADNFRSQARLQVLQIDRNLQSKTFANEARQGIQSLQKKVSAKEADLFKQNAGSQINTLEARMSHLRNAGTPRGPRADALSFLKAGRATHPDEQEVRDEYDLMIGALQSGENTGEAIRIAESHQVAHTNALRPEMRGTNRDPFPGQPEKNKAAADGFGSLLDLLDEGRSPLALGGVGGGFDTAGGVPTPRFPQGGGEATATAQGRLTSLQRALDEDAPGFLDSLRFNAQNREAFGSFQGGIPEGVTPTQQITPAQALKLTQRLDQGEFGGPEFPDNISLRKGLLEITEQGVKSQLGGSVVSGPLETGGVLPAVADKLGDVLKAEELTTGRLWEQLKHDVRTFDPFSNYQGVGSGGGLGGTGLGKGDTSQIGQTPNDLLISLRAVIGGADDEAALDAELQEIGVDSRILGPIFLSPANYFPVERLGTFIRGLGKIKLGRAALSDDAARFTVDVLKRADVSGGGFRQAGTAADISGDVGTDIAPRAGDVLATGATDVSGRVGADFAPTVADVPLATADIAAPRAGDFTPLGSLSGADINRAGTSITRAGAREVFRGADVSTSTDLVPARAAGEGASQADNFGAGVIGREVYLSPKQRTTGTVVGMSDDGSIATVRITNKKGISSTKDFNADELVPVGGRRGDLSVGGRLDDPTFDEAVRWYTDAIEEQRANILDNKGRIKRDRASQGASGDQAEQAALARGDTPEEAFRQKQAARRGDLSRATQVLIEPPNNIKQALLDRVNSFDFGRGTTGPDFERDRVKSVLFALSGGRDTPFVNSELLSLEKVLGTHFVDTLRPVLTKNKDGFWTTAFDLAVMPKAILSSLDLSYPFRQGIMAAPGHVPEFARSFGPMIRAGWSERGAREVLETMLQDPYIVRFADGTSVARGQLKQQHGLLRTLDPGMSTSEEAFRSSLAEKLTGPLGNFVRRSNRSFTTFGNKFRSDMFDTVIETWTRRNISIDEDRVLALSNMLNRFTGRGTLGAGTDAAGVTKAIQAVMWAPQYRLSGPQALATLRHPDRKIAAEAWRNMAAYMGTGMMILTAADISGAGSVGVDPLSGEFGKIRIGNIRINIWGTNAVLARTIARALTAQRALIEDILNVESGLPEPFQTNPLKIGWQYAQSGFAPQWAFVADLVNGENVIGEPVSLRAQGLSVPLLEEPRGLQAVVERNAIPLWLQDVKEAFQEEGMWGAAAVAPGAFFGVGVSAFGGDPSSQLREMPKWRDLEESEEKELRDFLDEVGLVWEERKGIWTDRGVDGPPWPLKKWEVAQVVGKSSDRIELGKTAAKAIRGTLARNAETMQFIVDNQDAMTPEDLAFGLTDKIALKFLTPENRERRARQIVLER